MTNCSVRGRFTFYGDPPYSYTRRKRERGQDGSQGSHIATLIDRLDYGGRGSPNLNPFCL